jgi:hypothetical protein
MARKEKISITWKDVAGIIWAVIKEYLANMGKDGGPTVDPTPEPEPKPGDKELTIRVRGDIVTIAGYRVTKIG